MTLTGQKNQCRGCGEYFRSNAAFDKHRTGEFNHRPSQRRCLTVDEMLERGMVKNAKGFWVTASNPFFAEAA